MVIKTRYDGSDTGLHTDATFINHYLQHGVQLHLYAFIYGLFEGDFNASNHKALTDRMIGEQGVATDLESKDSGTNTISSVHGNEPLLHVVQTGSGVHPTSYPMGTGGSFPGA
jgi:hypothetical protein